VTTSSRRPTALGARAPTASRQCRPRARRCLGQEGADVLQGCRSATSSTAASRRGRGGRRRRRRSHHRRRPDAGADRIDGGGGSDLLIATGRPAPVTIDLAAPAPRATADAVSAFENATGGSADELSSADGARTCLPAAPGEESPDRRAGGDRLQGGTASTASRPATGRPRRRPHGRLELREPLAHRARPRRAAERSRAAPATMSSTSSMAICGPSIARGGRRTHPAIPRLRREAGWPCAALPRGAARGGALSRHRARRHAIGRTAIAHPLRADAPVAAESSCGARAVAPNPSCSNVSYRPRPRRRWSRPAR
jgi:hypothetical protein